MGGWGWDGIAVCGCIHPSVHCIVKSQNCLPTNDGPYSQFAYIDILNWINSTPRTQYMKWYTVSPLQGEEMKLIVL